MRNSLRCQAARRFAGVVLLLVGVAACGSGRAVESEAVIPRDPGNLVGTHWILVATGDSDPIPAQTPFTLDIETGTASGTGPCNRFHLPFTHEGDDVTTGAVASTLVACTPVLSAAEHKFFTALEAVDTAEKEGTENQLVLSGPHSVRLVFDRADTTADDLAGRWDIVNYAAPTALQSTRPAHRADTRLR